MEPDPEKDRDVTLPLAYGRAEIVYRRSSTHPVTYALVLRIKQDRAWQTVLVVDNSHDERNRVDDHHVHRYAGGVKQPAEPLPFPVDDTNDAMAKAIRWIADNWEELSK